MATLIPFRAALPYLKDIDNPTDFFESAKRKFPMYLNEGLYQQIANPSVYIYRIQRPHRSHTGIIACTHIEDYLKGKIKAHENTLEEKENQMFGLFKERHAIIKPILLTYRNVLEIDALINRITISTPPTFSVPFADEHHHFWQIEDKHHLQELVQLFETHIPESYICDGHHRMRTSEQLYLTQQQHYPAHLHNENYDYILTGYFPASEIEIHNYNRVLLSLKGLSDEQFLQRLRGVYNIYATPKPVAPMSKNHLAMFLGKQWYKLHLREDIGLEISQQPIKEQLDVAIFNKYILQQILGIDDARTESEIAYTEGPKGAFALERAVREMPNAAAFWLYPVAIENLIQISDQQGTLPPKSTWIEPRMRNGFVVQLYADL